MGLPASAPTKVGPHIVIIAASRRPYHPFLHELTAAPSVLGNHYVVEMMTIDDALDDPFKAWTLILVDYDHGFATHNLDSLHVVARHTPLLLVTRTDESQVSTARNHHPLTRFAHLRLVVAQMLEKQYIDCIRYAHVKKGSTYPYDDDTTLH